MHYNRIDRRINVVKELIKPFQLQLNDIIETTKKQGIELWDMVYADDVEHTVGVVFIILQNYINSSIYDLYPSLKDQYLKYSISEKIDDTQATQIRLIISIANYYKHRDTESNLKENTTKYLTDLGINYKCFYGDKETDFFYKMGSTSPVFVGLSKLSNDWNFDDLIEIVSSWREKMWKIEEKTI